MKREERKKKAKEDDKQKQFMWNYVGKNKC